MNTKTKNPPVALIGNDCVRTFDTAYKTGEVTDFDEACRTLTAIATVKQHPKLLDACFNVQQGGKHEKSQVE
jgi:hypothetical protein